MIPTNSILSVVTLLFNKTIINSGPLEGYQPEYNTQSHLFYKNLSDPKDQFRSVEDNTAFYSDDIIFFRKCCPPHYLYETEKRQCIESKNTSNIYDDLKLDFNLLYSSVGDCLVVADRFVKKGNLEQLNNVIDARIEIESTSAEEGYLSYQYCLDKVYKNDDYFVVRLCFEKEYCTDGTKNRNKDWCLHKCCIDSYRVKNRECEFNRSSSIPVRKNKNYFKEVDGYAIFHRPKLNCTAADRFNFKEHAFIIQPSGDLYMNDSSKTYKFDEYCIDTNYETSSGRLFDVILICENRILINVQWILTRITVIITCICFLLTILIYIFVYKLKKLIEKVIICFCFVDIIFWIMYGLRIIETDIVTFCTGFGYIYYFVTIGRLSWLNVLSYEIWRTIGCTRANIGQTRESLRKKFLYYFFYGMGIPSLMTVIYIMGHLQVYSLPEVMIPHINPNGCNIDMRGLDGNLGHLFLFIPVSVLIIINLIFFAMTITHFIKIKRDLKKLMKSNTMKHRKMQQANSKKGYIILKLGLVMGITWIYYLCGYLNTFLRDPIFTDIGRVLSFANILEGFYFLVIFTFNWKTAKKICYKVNIFKKTDSQETTTSSKFTETTSGMDMQTFTEDK